MPWSLRRYQQSGQTHYITFSCYRRLQKLGDPRLRNLLVNTRRVKIVELKSNRSGLREGENVTSGC